MGNQAGTISAPKVFLGFETAVLFWRAVHEGRLAYPKAIEQANLPQAYATTYRDLAKIDFSPLGVTLQRDGISASYHTIRKPQPSGSSGATLWTEQLVADGLAIPPGSALPLHVLTDRQASRGTIRCARVHLMPSNLPPRSFYAVTDQILISSPELTFLHVSRSPHALPRIELLCEWCGSYALGPLSGNCHNDRPPLTDLYRLEDYFSHDQAPRGSTSARQALTHVVEGLASPRETETFLALTLPVELGGFSLPAPFVNQQIPLKATAYAQLCHQDFFSADLFWPAAKLIVEYDGFEDHELTPHQVAKDKERRSVLAAMGYTVIVITKRDLKSRAAFERKARQIALAMGCTIPDVAGQELVARRMLFSWLFDASHDHIPFGFGYH